MDFQTLYDFTYSLTKLYDETTSEGNGKVAYDVTVGGVTYTVEAGTYKIVSPQSDYGRGYRIMSVVVVDGIE